MTGKELGEKPVFPWLVEPEVQGETLRQRYAAMAMQGLVSTMSPKNMYAWSELADYAVAIADTLLDELAKDRPDEDK